MAGGLAAGATHGAESLDVKTRIAGAAERARAEAEQRRTQPQAGQPRPQEINGRDGPEPVRYGDWESRGLASDF